MAQMDSFGSQASAQALIRVFAASRLGPGVVKGGDTGFGGLGFPKLGLPFGKHRGYVGRIYIYIYISLYRV